MLNELLTKKLSIFHHPLFQNICCQWKDCISQDRNSINLMIFAELNMRIQKSLMDEFELDNAFMSALNDWQQEVETLSFQEQIYQKKPISSKQKMEKELRKIFAEMLTEISFEGAFSTDLYLALFDHSKHHEGFNFCKDHISMEGFFKFLFDLSYSWCDEHDVELFSFLITGIFLQITRVNASGKRSFEKLDSISRLSDTFMTQHKRLKAHYNKYKKMDLFDYESWYKWNYLPARINEMKARAKENFLSCFPTDQTIISYLDELYDGAIVKIIQENLEIPRNPFVASRLQAQNENGSGDNSLLSFNDQIFETDAKVVKASPKNSHIRITKKVVLPIFGKTIPKPPNSQKLSSEEKPRTHSIKSPAIFLDIFEEETQLDTDQAVNQGLGPIWENEFSETNSTKTLENFYRSKHRDPTIDSFFVKLESGQKIPYCPNLSKLTAKLETKDSKKVNSTHITYDENLPSFITTYNSNHISKLSKELSDETYAKQLKNLSRNLSQGRKNKSSKMMAKIEQITSMSERQNAIRNQGFGVNTSDFHIDSDSYANSSLTQTKGVQNYLTSISQSEGIEEQKKYPLRGIPQIANKKGFYQEINLAGFLTTSQTIPLENPDIISNSPSRKTHDNKDMLLPAIEIPRHPQFSYKEVTYQGNSGEKINKCPISYDGSRTQSSEQIISKIRHKLNGITTNPSYIIEKPKLDSSKYVWQVKDNFNEKERESFLDKMNQRLEKNKKRQENKSKSTSNKRKTRRDRSADIGPRTKVFLNPQNKSLFKEVFI